MWTNLEMMHRDKEIYFDKDHRTTSATTEETCYVFR